MCNLQPNRKIGFTLLLSMLIAGCGIKWATNKVLSNPDAIAKVGAVYDALTPRDTTEKLVFIEGDSIVVVKSDTVYNIPNYGFLIGKNDNEIFRLHQDSSITFNDAVYRKLELPKDTIRITNTRTIRRTDTLVKQLPPDNRAMARLLDSLGVYANELNKANGTIAANNKALKTAENRLIWMAAVLLLAGVVIGVLVRFKIIPNKI